MTSQYGQVFLWFFFGPRAIAELVAVLQFALPAARAVFQTLSKFGYNTAV